MKIWIDVLTPKQVLFFNGIAGELIKRGYDVFFTVRDFRETTGLAQKYLMKRHVVWTVGKYGGGDLRGKLVSSLERSLALVDIISREEPDAAISFTSPDAARVSFGLGIPHIAVSDTPHAKAVSKLTLPLSKALYTPWVIPRSRWVRYGIDRDRIMQYRGLDPVVWILRHVIDKETVERYGLDDMKYIVVRPIESKASYQLNTDYRRMLGIEKWVPRFIRETNGDYRVLIIPRYLDQITYYKNVFGKYRDNIIILDQVVDGLTLLKYSSGFVGYGGTMTMESALIGKPTLTLRPGRLPECIQYLVKRGVVKKMRSIKRVVEVLKKQVKHMEETGERPLIEEMEDPARYISETITKVLSQ